jgi:hypothetical protein
MENRFQIIRDANDISVNRAVAIGPVAMKLLGQSAVKAFERWQDERVEQDYRKAAREGASEKDGRVEVVAHAASSGDQSSFAGLSLAGRVMPRSRRNHSR